MLSKLTLIGMHNYSEGAIWDDVVLPEGIEKELLINEILKQNGEFCLIYPQMDFLKAQITFFFRKCKIVPSKKSVFIEGFSTFQK